MSEKNTLRTRLVNKHDIEANWLKATNFTPLQGELIVYDADENYNYERIKMGDGVTNVNELPFVSPQADWNQNDESATDYVKNRTHYVIREVKPIVLADGGGTNFGDFLVQYASLSPVDKFEAFEVGKSYVVTCNGISDTLIATSTTILSSGTKDLVNIKEKYPNIALFGMNAYAGSKNYSIRVEGGNLDDVWMVSKEEIVIHQLDEKYIPSTIARVSDIPDTVTIDPALTIEGAAADAKAVGDLWRAVADDDDVIWLLAQLGLIQKLADETGAILTDEVGNILLL